MLVYRYQFISRRRKKTDKWSIYLVVTEIHHEESSRKSIGRFVRGLTGDVVAQYPRRDNSAVRTEEILQILLRHIFRQAADIQIRTFDRLAARSRVRYLEKQKSKKNQEINAL